MYMKKLFLLLMVVIAMTACEGPMGPQGVPGEAGSLLTKVEYFTVKPSDWKFMGPSDNPNEVYYQYTVTPKFYSELGDKELEWLYNDGAIHTYLFRNFDQNGETQTPLPYVLNWADNNNKLCIETVYSDYTMQDVAFYIAYSGANQDSSPTQDMHFRIVANW